MYCRNCGQKNGTHANFCERCGRPLQRSAQAGGTHNGQTPGGGRNTATGAGYSAPPAAERVSAAGAEQNSAPPRSQKNKSATIIIIAAATLIMLVCILAVAMHFGGKPSAEYNAMIETAGQYMEEMDYVKAEDAYLEAIAIEPKQKDAYIKLADLYVVQERYEEAAAMLQLGFERTSAPEVEEKQQEVSWITGGHPVYDVWLEEEAVSELGVCSNIQYEYDGWDAGYDGDAYGWMYGWCSESGIMSRYVCDLDGDGTEELILVYSRAIDDEAYVEVCRNEQVNGLYLRIYSMKDEEVFLADELLLDAPFDGTNCDRQLLAVPVEGKCLLVYYTKDRSYVGSVKEFAVFEFNSRRKLQANLLLYDPGYTSGQGLFLIDPGILSDLNTRQDRYSTGDEHVCLYEGDPSGPYMGSRGIYDTSYADAVTQEFRKAGISVRVEDNENAFGENYGFDFFVTSEGSVRIIRVVSEFDYESDFLTARIESCAQVKNHYE